jgi:uncharacterized membrane protein
MNKEEYLKALSHALKKIPEEEKADILQYYWEYFNDAGEEKEAEVIAELGPPKKLAAQLRAEFTYEDAVKNPKSAKKSIRSAWVSVGAVCAAPIAVPLAITIAAVVASLVIALLALFVSLFVVFLCLGLSAILFFIAAVVVFFNFPPTGLFLSGAGLVCAGITGLGFVLLIQVFSSCFRGLAGLINKGIGRRIKQ